MGPAALDGSRDVASPCRCVQIIQLTCLCSSAGPRVGAEATARASTGAGATGVGGAPPRAGEDADASSALVEAAGPGGGGRATRTSRPSECRREAGSGDGGSDGTPASCAATELCDSRTKP